MIKSVKDNVMIFKETVKAKMLRNQLLRRFHPESNDISKTYGEEKNEFIKDLIKSVGLKKIYRIIAGKPNTIIIISDDRVIRIPLDSLSAKRCHTNKIILKELSETNIAQFVPKFLGSGSYKEQVYFFEQRLSGFGLDIPLNRMNDLVEKAADFIGRFHRKTSNEINLNELNYNRLFSKEFERLSTYLDEEYSEKLKKVEKTVKQQLINQKFKIVWFHGDYKIENVLFDVKTWQIKGIIDWDLSKKEGLPLLDIFYLLTYKESLITGESVVNIFNNRFWNMGFNSLEKRIIDKYLGYVGISSELIKPILVMFAINHISQRYQQQLIENSSRWVRDNVCVTIDRILNSFMETK